MEKYIVWFEDESSKFCNSIEAVFKVANYKTTIIIHKMYFNNRYIGKWDEPFNIFKAVYTK